MTPPAPFAPAALKLLRGALYHDDPQWRVLRDHEGPLREWFARVGLTVEVWEADGFAILRQTDEGGEGTLPRLLQRHRLSLPVTLLCVALRDRLARHDAAGTDAPRLVLSRAELRDELRPFFPPHADEVRLDRLLGRAVGQAEELGFLRALPDAPAFEVRRLIRALFDADRLTALRDALRTHLAHDRAEGETPDAAA